MAEFPREELQTLATYLDGIALWSNAAHIGEAIKAYDELAERLVMDAVKASLEIANLRARLREVDPQFPKP